ncbi:MAG: hypothetical protein DCC75_07810, partial [Proteobacteria bacterium]
GDLMSKPSFVLLVACALMLGCTLLLGEYADNPERTKELPAEKKERYLQTQNELTRSRTHLGVLFRRLWGMITSHQKKQVLRVSFHGTLHPGTVITADKVEFRPDQALHGPATVVFSIKEKCFKVVDYQPLN